MMHNFVDEGIVFSCFAIVAEVKADVPIDILPFGRVCHVCADFAGVWAHQGPIRMHWRC